MSTHSPNGTKRSPRPWKPSPQQIEMLQSLVEFGEYGQYESSLSPSLVASLARAGAVEKFVPVAHYYTQEFLGRRRYVRITEKGRKVLDSTGKKS